MLDNARKVVQDVMAQISTGGGRHVMNCYKCGTEAPSGAKFCGNCGARLEAYGPVIPDPANHDKTYRRQIAEKDWLYLDDFFYSKYERKLDRLTDWEESRVAAIWESDAAPDKKVADYDKLLDDLEHKIRPFYDSMVPYYSPVILDHYWSLVHDVEQERTRYLEQDYQREQIEYAKLQQEQKALAAVKRDILTAFKDQPQILQYELLKRFGPAKQPLVKHALKDLLQEGQLLRGKVNLGSRGRWVLTVVR